MSQKHRGSCHCGAVRFEAEIDLAEGTSRCNCSICGKSRFWKAIAAPGTFKLLAGQDALSDYTFGKGSIHHLFCRRCGVKTFGRGEHPDLGGTFHAVNVACLDDVSEADLDAATVHYEDGKHDRWEHPPERTGYL